MRVCMCECVHGAAEEALLSKILGGVLTEVCVCVYVYECAFVCMGLQRKRHC